VDILINNAGLAGYNVAKAGVVALSETLRVELAPDNIDVTVCCPTVFKSGLLDDVETDTLCTGKL
jgi:NAD(P)-dependent dehydrogenase (short-subunit alcohol dehydrogenase family)